MIKSLLLCFLAAIFIEPSAQAARKRISVGTVKEAVGAPDVLRNPSARVSPELKRRAKQENFAITLFKKRYWEAYKIAPGMKLFYGDQLASGNSTQMHISLEHGIELTLAPNTTVRISRGFLKKQQQSTGEKWISLLSGTIRAKARGTKKERHTKFRTKTMAMGVRGTDFVIESKNGKSKLITIEGKVAVRVVTPAENQLFEAYSAPDATVPEEALAKQATALAQIATTEEQSEIVLERGMKVELPEPAEAEPMGLALAKTKKSPPVKIEAVKVDSQDLNAVRAITNKLSQADRKDDQENLETLISETTVTEQKTSPTPAMAIAPHNQHVFELATSNIGIRLERQDGESTELESHSWSLSYNWRWHRYTSLGFVFIADAPYEGEAGGLRQPTTRGKVESQSSLAALRVNGRYSWGGFSLGGSFNLWLPAEMTFRFATPKGDVDSKVQLNIKPMINLKLAYRFTNHWGIFMEAGGSELEIKEIGSSYINNLPAGGEQQLSFSRFGVSYGM